MTWTKLGDDFNDRPELLSVSRSARLLYVEALVYGNRVGTDGRIPRAQVQRFTDAGPDAEIAELEAAGLWVPLESEDAWQVDWKHQEKAETVRARQEYRRSVQETYRRRKELHQRGDHIICDPRYCPALRKSAAVVEEPPPAVTSNTSSHVSSNKTVPVTSSRPDPVPTRPKAAGKGQGGSPAATAKPQRIAPRCTVCDKVEDRCRAERPGPDDHAFTIERSA